MNRNELDKPFLIINLQNSIEFMALSRQGLGTKEIHIDHFYRSLALFGLSYDNTDDIEEIIERSRF